MPRQDERLAALLSPSFGNWRRDYLESIGRAPPRQGPPTSIFDEFAMFPTGVGDLAEIGSFVDRSRSPEFREQLKEPIDYFGWQKQRFQSVADALRGRGSWGNALSALLSHPMNDAQTRALTAMMPLVTAYHGSPHKFDEFNTSKIGTGEGAQAYGHGLYFSEDPNVAGIYQRNVKDMAMVDAANKRMSELAKIMEAEQIPGAYRQFRTAAGRAAAAEYDALMAQKTAPGHMYKVDIPDEAVSRMLDWNKPLSEQPESVRKAMSELLEFYQPSGMVVDADRTARYSSWDMQNLTGAQAKELLETKLGAARTSQVLSESGIPGIRFAVGGEGGARNLVLFDDKLATITGRE